MQEDNNILAKVISLRIWHIFPVYPGQGVFLVDALELLPLWAGSLQHL